MALENVKKYYASFDEWARLGRPTGRLEFERALGFLDRFLPRPCRLLDLGSGPGRYAIELANRGHHITLADLSSAQLEIAHDKIAEAGLKGNVEGFYELNATNLDCFDAESFDAVVAFGPFYHLIAREDRQKAAGEIARVVRPGGFVFVAFVPPFFHLSHLIARAVSNPEQVGKENFIEALEKGVFINRHDTGFQEAYFAYPSEIEETLAGVGLQCQLIASLRGIANAFEAELYSIAERDHELFSTIMDILDRTSTITSVVEMAGHALAVARKTTEPQGDNALDGRDRKTFQI
jgi:SAM-dependent methyltransferase